MHRLSRFFLHYPVAALLALSPLAGHAGPDPLLAFAIDKIWHGESPAVSILEERLEAKDPKQPSRYYFVQTKDAPSYTVLSDEDASVEYAGKRFSAVKSFWGELPVLQPENTKLLEMSVGRNRYLVLSGPGSRLFTVGDWQRYTFLEVLNVSRRAAPYHYALISDANLGERVLGRLPGSPVMNYARLVPTRWASNTEPSAYEVLIYALETQGLKRVIDEGKPLAYSLTHEGAGGAWQLQRIDQTPVADARDKAGLAFTVSTRQEEAPAPQPDPQTKPQSTR